MRCGLGLFVWLCLVLAGTLLATGLEERRDGVEVVVSMSFLVSVNLTWGECIQTVKTPALKPDQNWNDTQPVVVGNCDKGPLTYRVVKQPLNDVDCKSENHTFVEVTFYTTAIAIQPPSCRILWDYSYLLPTKAYKDGAILPGCFINDSQEGYHVTYYWFHILEWLLA